MLIKLLKYDLKYMLKNMLIFYILSIFFAITTRILFSINQTVIVNIISQISVGCLFSLIANILINTMMRSWIRFRDSLYKDESYLTHTLPVTKNDIYNSKFLQTLIFFIISFIIIILSLFITYYTKDRWLALNNLVDTITIGLDLNKTIFIISFILMLIFWVYAGTFCAIFKNSQFEFVDGPLLTAMKNGEPILLDEFNLCSEEVLTNLLPIIKSSINDKLYLKDQSCKLNF